MLPGSVLGRGWPQAGCGGVAWDSDAGRGNRPDAPESSLSPGTVIIPVVEAEVVVTLLLSWSRSRNMGGRVTSGSWLGQRGKSGRAGSTRILLKELVSPPWVLLARSPR